MTKKDLQARVKKLRVKYERVYDELAKLTIALQDQCKHKDVKSESGYYDYNNYECKDCGKVL